MRCEQNFRSFGCPVSVLVPPGIIDLALHQIVPDLVLPLDWSGHLHWCCGIVHCMWAILIASLHVLCCLLALLPVYPCVMLLPLGVITCLHKLAAILQGIFLSVPYHTCVLLLRSPVSPLLQLHGAFSFTIGFCLVLEALS